jgi:redox-sensing transcriptional repressor
VPKPTTVQNLESVSCVTLHRLSEYLRCLRYLEGTGIEKISSGDLAERFHLSAAQIRKDLAHFGEFGIRGVGYDISHLADRIKCLLGLDQPRAVIVAGMGNLGSALTRFLSIGRETFEVVAGVDSDPSKIGEKIGHLTIRPVSELPRLVDETRAEIGILAVPADAAQSVYEAFVSAGVQAVLNFAPVRLPSDKAVRTRNVDLQVFLEELSYFLRAT